MDHDNLLPFRVFIFLKIMANLICARVPLFHLVFAMDHDKFVLYNLCTMALFVASKRMRRYTCICNIANLRKIYSSDMAFSGCRITSKHFLHFPTHISIYFSEFAMSLGIFLLIFPTSNCKNSYILSSYRYLNFTNLPCDN